MKKLFLIVSLVPILMGIANGQSVEKPKLFTPQELSADLDTLAKYIEETHPNAFYKLSKTEFNQGLETIKRKMDTPISSVDFYFLISPLIAKIEDGHTFVRFPGNEFLETNPYHFTYKVKLSNQEPYILVVRPYRTFVGELPAGTEILSINGIESKRIIQDIINLNSGESRDFRLERSVDFNFYLTGWYKMEKTFTVKYKEKNQIKTKTIQGIRNETLFQRLKADTTGLNQVQTNSSNYSITIRPEISTAIIDFVSFSDLESFKKFIDSAFTQIQQQKIRNLIIDIRKNGGGNSAIGDEFFQYIAHHPFNQFAKTKVKYSNLRSRCYNEYFLATKDSSFFLGTNKTDGTTEEFSDTSTVPLRDNPLRFNGNIYLLTSVSTFSSASDFAQCFKYYKMGTIIGQETGGWIVCYGDVISGVLPNTQLQVGISHKLFYSIGARKDDFHGVIPDIEIPSEKALDYTLDKITKKQ